MTTFSTEEQWYIDHLVKPILEEGRVHENLAKLMLASPSVCLALSLLARLVFS